MMLKNLLVFVIAMSALIHDGLSFAQQNNGSYEQRKAIYVAWKTDLNQLATSSSEKLLKDVNAFLENVTLVIPENDGKIRPINAKGTDRTRVFVLLSSDRMNKIWNAMYSQTNVAANFIPEMNLLVIRAEKMAHNTRGILLGHEGMHALAFAAEQNLKQTDEEYCSEEAIAHRLEIEVFRGFKTQFASAVDNESVKMANGMKKNGGRVVNTNLKLDNTMLDAVFGKAESELDTNYRATIFSNAVLVGAFLQYYNKDESQVMPRFSAYLCGIYKASGIR